jgi:WD40 repeat protein
VGLVASVNSNSIELYALDDGRLIDSLDADHFGLEWFLLPSLDSTGRYMGVGTNGPLVVVIDIEAVLDGTAFADAIVLSLEGHKGNTPVVDVTSDGVAVSAGLDGFYRAWDLATGEKLWEIRVEGLEDPPTAFISWDETELAYEDADGVIRFTPLDNDVVVKRAQAALTRELTDDECRQYLHTDGCESDS